MTNLYELPVSQVINAKYSILTEEFYFNSSIVGHCVVPKGFTFDWESVPILRGTCKVGGLIHDYLCRSDSKPVVTKKTAAKVYLEFMKFRGNSLWRRMLKYNTVRVAPNYFHKKKVLWKFNL